MIRQIYFRDTHTTEFWKNVSTGGWIKIDNETGESLSPDEINEYVAFDTKPAEWLGDRKTNPIPVVKI